jgi:YHS domain-containing protein
LLLLASGVRAEDLGNTWCPVKPDEKALSRFRSEYEGKAVHFCCRDCVTTFESDPGTYLGLLPQFTIDSRPTWRLPFDRAWNTGLRFPGIALGLLALAGITLSRGLLALLRVSGWPRKALAAVGSPKGLGFLALLAIGGETLSAHHKRAAAEQRLAEDALENWIHFATFTDYGVPPIPSPPSHSHRLDVTYYRGNDERSPLLFNGGFYRTSSFDLTVCRADGIPLVPGNPAPPIDDLFLKVQINRAPGTPDYFWTPERMDLMFATRESGKFLGRFEPVDDAITLDTLEPMQRWEIRYPLAAFVAPATPDRVEGIVYLCEKRFDANDRLVGGRFHYGFQFALDFAEGEIQAASSLWMGSLYRSRILRIWQIPEREWLSTDPIPVIEGEHLTEDPEILGISGHKLDRN